MSFRDPYVMINFTTIILFSGFISLIIVFGSAGISLVTGEYNNHQKTLHRVWLILCVFTVMSILWALMAFSGVQ